MKGIITFRNLSQLFITIGLLRPLKILRKGCFCTYILLSSYLIELKFIWLEYLEKYKDYLVIEYSLYKS